MVLTRPGDEVVLSTRNGMAEICADNLLAGVKGEPLRAWVNPDVAAKRRR